MAILGKEDLMAKKRRKSNEIKRQAPLTDIFKDKHASGELITYKQGAGATRFILKEGSLGLSAPAEKLYYGLMAEFTNRGFNPLPEDAPEKEELNSAELYGEKGSEFLDSVPTIRFHNLSLQCKAMTGRNTPLGQDYEDLKKAKAELMLPAERTYERKRKNAEGKIITEEISITSPLFIFREVTYREKEQDHEGAQEKLLFEHTIYDVTIGHPMLVEGVTKSAMGVDSQYYTVLPKSVKDMFPSEEETFSTPEERLIRYITNSSMYNIFPFPTQKGKERTLFSEEFLVIKVMRKTEKEYKGKNRSRAIKELTQALEKVEKLSFVKKTEHLKETKEVAIYWNLKA